MKKIFVITFSILMVTVASGQRKYVPRYHSKYVPRYHNYRPSYGPHTGVIVGYGPIYPYYPYGYGYWTYRPHYVPTKLELQIEDIENDYKDRIWSVRHDDQLSKKERRKRIHELKHERDGAILDAKRNYYRKYE